jgi:DNA-binding response OmpR family regulator
VCAEFRKRTDELKDLPVILLTGVDEFMGGALAENAGVQKYLSKPVNPRELLDAVKELTGG